MSEWIKMEDRLPEDGQECFVYNGYKVYEAITFKRGDMSGYPERDCFIAKPETWEEAQGLERNWELTEISHWMPKVMPEPPQKQKDEVGNRVEVSWDGKWQKGTIINGYRTYDGLVTVMLDVGEAVSCGASRFDDFIRLIDEKQKEYSGAESEE